MSEDSKKLIDRAEELCVLCEEEDAEDLIREALETNPKNLDLKTELAIILSRRGNERKAETILREVLSMDRLHERATSALGNLLGNSLRTEEAEELFEKYLEKLPNGHMVLDDYSRLLYDSDRVDEALELGRQHIAAYSRELAAYNALRYILEIQEDDLAEDLYDFPEDVKRLERLAVNLIEQHVVLMDLKNREIIPEDDVKNTEDIEEDIQRVVAEIRSIRKRNGRNKKKLSKSLLGKIKMILDSVDQ